jgi:hypothetical protein
MECRLQITIDGKEFVAKRFVEIGKGPQNVSLKENESELEKEAARLMRAKWFLRQFQDEAEEHDYEISQGTECIMLWLYIPTLHPSTEFEFTDCFLVEEVIGGPSNNVPSPASGITKDQFYNKYDLNCDNGTLIPRVCWLLEPLRTQAFTRYTGTLKHPTLRGKLGSSIHAFVHYAFEVSGEDLLFADIQGLYCIFAVSICIISHWLKLGSLTRKPGGSSGHVLFDIMSHSTDGYVHVHSSFEFCR